jgi:NAD+ synthase
MKNKITKWIKDKVKESKAAGIVMGLSGGIDSAVVAALSKNAVGKNRVLGLFLPCHSHSSDIKDAILVAKKLGIKTKKIDLSKVYDQLLKILPSGNKLASANLRPRLRMLTLYYFANSLNYLVCGTGNRSELMAGYFTKYGDGGVDILPIADLYKKDVRKLAKELSIPSQVIAKPPSAGLWPGQTDEGEMGITYDELDGILSCMVEGRRQLENQDKVNKVKYMIKRSGHKRSLPEICKIQRKRGN